jgi:hypothetical protein
MKKLTIGSLVFAATSAAVAAPQDYNRLDILAGLTSASYDASPFAGTTETKFDGYDFGLHVNKIFKENLIFDFDVKRSHVANDDNGDFAVDITTINTSLGYVVRADNYDGSLKLGYASNDEDVIQTSATTLNEGAYAEVNASYKLGESMYAGISHRRLVDTDDGQSSNGVSTVRLLGTYGEDEGLTPYELAISKRDDIYTASFEILPFGLFEDDLNRFGFRLEKTEGDNLDGNAVYFFIRAYPEED